jgi:hypothetical protein
MILKEPIDRVNSWNYLYTKLHSKESKILVPLYFDMYDYMENDFSEMALNFKNRSIIINLFDLVFNETLFKKTYELCLKNNSVVAVDNIVAHYIKSKYFTISEVFDYHISESGFGSKHYSLPTTSRLNSTLMSKLNYVLVFIYYIFCQFLNLFQYLMTESLNQMKVEYMNTK